MPQYLTPGVYVEEISGGSKPIEAASPSVVGFLGVAEKGVVGKPTLVTNWAQYTRLFGGMHKNGWLGHAVYMFYQNGGTRCYINNLAEPPAAAPAKKDAKADAKGADAKADPKAAEVAKEEFVVKNPDNITKLIIGKDEGPGKKTGLCAFSEISDIAIVSAPGVYDPAAQDAILSHCENERFRVAVLDSPETLEKGLNEMPKPRDSQLGAYYFPWVKMYDPDNDVDVIVPPSGGVSGLMGRVDGTRGVHKAPANEILRGAIGLKYNLTNVEQELLNPKGINCIRDFPGKGIRVWGARTISSDPEWRYLNVRRLFCMLEKAVQDGTDWVVFEPNTRDLWKKIVRNITSFLLGFYKSGAFFGDSPEEAFYVRCDDELNPPESIDAGNVVCEIGIAPAKPAEFVTFRFTQKTIDD